MDDKTIMQNLLNNTKAVCDLYMHGTVESATVNVHQTFSTALNDALCMQDSIYKKMSEKGWYQNQTAPQQQVDQLRQKFSAQS